MRESKNRDVPQSEESSPFNSLYPALQIPLNPQKIISRRLPRGLT